MGDDFFDPMSGFDMSSPGDIGTGVDPDQGADPSLFGGFPGFAGGAIMRASTPRISGGLAGNPGRLYRAGRGVGLIATKFGTITVRKAWDLAKKLGPELAAGALGYTVVDFLSAVLADGIPSPRRRRRGISGRDIRTTRRVCRFAASLNHDLAMCGPRHLGFKRRRAAC